MARPPKNLFGQRFGRLLAVAEEKERSRGYTVWTCLCDCGNQHRVASQLLLNGHTQSCGCLQSDNMRKLNESKKDLKVTVPVEAIIDDN